MTRRLLLTYLTITAFVLLILGIPLGINFANTEREQLAADIERDATVLATLVEDQLETGTGPEPLPVVVDYQDRTNGRVVVVDADGLAVADSTDPEGAPRDFSTRPEIDTALSGERSSGTRFSETLDQRIIYVAVPVASSGTVHGAVRITHDTAELDKRIRKNWLTLGLIGIVVLGAVTVVGFILARSVTRPVRALAVASGALAAGDLAARAEIDRGPPEVRALARQFNEMAERLEKLVGSQRAFVADASHQLRTPLTALRLRLENLESTAPAGASADLEAGTREVARLGRLVEGLLAIARAEGMRPERRPVDAATVARERVEAWAPLAEERGLHLTLDAEHDAPALAVEGALDQVLDNLLDNAMEATPDGGTITVTVDTDEDGVTIHVIDDGPGMSDDERSRAFDRFWRGAEGDAAGSGLGLAIVHQLVSASGGHVELHDAAPTGLDVVVRLLAASISAPLTADG